MARKKPKPPPENPWDEAYIESLAWHKDYVKDARKVLNKGGFGKVESRADGRGWWVECEGMTGTYQVSVRPDPEAGFVATCSCPSNKNPCKHALALLLYLVAHPEERVEPTPVSSAQSVDLDTLVRAAFSNPMDDTPRLILADCVEELGQPARAALIRVQCERDHIGIGRQKDVELKAEEDKLMPAVLAEMGPIPDTMTATFRRGFVTLRAKESWWGRESGTLPAKFLELFRDGWIETVAIEYGYDLPPWLIGLLRQVREVDFSDATLNDRDLVVIASDLQPGRDGARLQSVRVPSKFKNRYQELITAATSGPLAGTETVTEPVAVYTGQEMSSRVSHALLNLNPAQFALLAHAGHLRGAQNLWLQGAIGDAGISTLLATPELDSLTRLDLTDSGISAGGLKTLAGSLAGQLLWLAVINSPVGDAGATALRGVKWGQLGRLTLTTAGLTDASANVLHECDFPALKWFDLSNNAITPVGAATLLGSPRLASVLTWVLSGNPVPTAKWFPLMLSTVRPGVTVHFTKATAELAHTLDKPDELHLQLRGSHEAIPGLFDEWASCSRAVTCLFLSKLRFDSTEATSLAVALAGKPVSELHVTDCQLRNDVVIPLAKRLTDMKLDVLDLSNNEIGKRGADALAASPGLASVRVLMLSGNPLRASGVDSIIDSPYLTSLECLMLPAKDIPVERQKEICAKFGKGVTVTF